jgi:acyl-CoA thioester hydrolase
MHRTDIQVRFADTDLMGHLNNTSYALYVEQARLEFLREATGEMLSSFILAHLALDFRRQVHFGQAIHVLTSVEKVGRTSVTLAQTILADDVPSVDARSVIVRFDYEAQRPAPFTDEARAWLEARMA